MAAAPVPKPPRRGLLSTKHKALAFDADGAGVFAATKGADDRDTFDEQVSRILDDTVAHIHPSANDVTLDTTQTGDETTFLDDDDAESEPEPEPGPATKSKAEQPQQQQTPESWGGAEIKKTKVIRAATPESELEDEQSEPGNEPEELEDFEPTLLKKRPGKQLASRKAKKPPPPNPVRDSNDEAPRSKKAATKPITKATSTKPPAKRVTEPEPVEGSDEDEGGGDVELEPTLLKKRGGGKQATKKPNPAKKAAGSAKGRARKPQQPQPEFEPESEPETDAEPEQELEDDEPAPKGRRGPGDKQVAVKKPAPAKRAPTKKAPAPEPEPEPESEVGAGADEPEEEPPAKSRKRSWEQTKSQPVRKNAKKAKPPSPEPESPEQAAAAAAAKAKPGRARPIPAAATRKRPTKAGSNAAEHVDMEDGASLYRANSGEKKKLAPPPPLPPKSRGRRAQPAVIELELELPEEGSEDEREEQGEEEEEEKEVEPPKKKKRAEKPRPTRAARSATTKKPAPDAKTSEGGAAEVSKASTAATRKPATRKPAVAAAADKGKGKVPMAAASELPEEPKGSQRVIHQKPPPTPHDDAEGKRRSHRRRLAPLQYWKGEKVEYTLVAPTGDDRRKSSVRLPEMVQVVRVESDEDEDKKKKKRAVRKRAGSSAPAAAITTTAGGRKRKLALEDAEDAESDPGEPDLWEEGVGLNDEEVGIKRGLVCAFPPYVDSDGDGIMEEKHLAYTKQRILTVDVANGSFKFVKTFSQTGFGTGIIELPPGGIKREKNSGKMTLVFYVIAGRITITIAKNRFRVGKGGQFMVPRGMLSLIFLPLSLSRLMRGSL